MELIWLDKIGWKGSDDYTEVTYDKEKCLSDHYTAPVTPPPLAYISTPLFLATMEHFDTFFMGDEVISTILAREINEFIKSSVDDLVSILRESKLGEPLDTLSTGDREVDSIPSRDIEELERLLVDDPVPVPRVFDEPLGHSDLISRSFDVTFPNPLFNFNDDYTLCYNNPLFDEEFEDISSLDPPKSTPVIDESSLLVTPPPASNQLSLREVDRFDPSFSLT
uniref:NAC domain-containing protein n=1 Tax=Tanacetum cinerariifolium TaxID=118510 RepID=A0A6L2P002_TANCI|nr:NAC domain-containing protein [Tanacetum cinerariifolium]